MTKPPYPRGWPAGSKARGIASSPDDYAWGVYFNNGNANWNHHDNDGFVRACRASEYPVSLHSLYAAWREARRGKRPSQDRLAFDSRWIDELLQLQHELRAGEWRPSPPTCFVAARPKAREIHAPAFRDRVVHHWLVPQLEAVYDPIFIHDSFSNRVGRGTHAAVDRLQGFVRQVHSGQGGGWYLQLDVHNFFNSIHRPTLYRLLKERMTRHHLPEVVQRVVHALLRHSAEHAGVRHMSTPAERARVPAHKRLGNAPPGCGLAIGNLSSQFFANVYLDRLDQFVKHELRAQRYVRYVDDFVLVHRDREQLLAWKEQIEQFLQARLRLELKPGAILRPLASGIDFLGYVAYPTHRLVRRRVVHHAREQLQAWQRAHARLGRVHAAAEGLGALRSTWSSYCGHFSHAASGRIYERLHREFLWLRGALLRANSKSTRRTA